MTDKEKDEEIATWLGHRVNIRKEQDGDLISRLRFDGGCWVVAQWLQADGFSTTWSALESREKHGFITLKDGYEIAERVSQMSKVVKVVVLGIQSCREIPGPRWGHPIAEERAERST